MVEEAVGCGQPPASGSPAARIRIGGGIGIRIRIWIEQPAAKPNHPPTHAHPPTPSAGRRRGRKGKRRRVAGGRTGGEGGGGGGGAGGEVGRAKTGVRGERAPLEGTIAGGLARGREFECGLGIEFLQNNVGRGRGAQKKGDAEDSGSIEHTGIFDS